MTGQIWGARLHRAKALRGGSRNKSERSLHLRRPGVSINADVVSPNTAFVFCPVSSYGSTRKADKGGIWQGIPHVPGKAVNEIILTRWASSAITTMFLLSDSTGCRSAFSSGKNLWMVVKITPPYRPGAFAAGRNGFEPGPGLGARRPCSERRCRRVGHLGHCGLSGQLRWDFPSLGEGSRVPHKKP